MKLRKTNKFPFQIKLPKRYRKIVRFLLNTIYIIITIMGGGLSIGNVGTERIVEQWASKLPLVEKLSELLLGQLQLPADLEAVASLSSDQVKEISRQFSASLEEVLLSSISKLKAALEIQQTQKSNPKFGMFPRGSGTILAKEIRAIFVVNKLNKLTT